MILFTAVNSLNAQNCRADFVYNIDNEISSLTYNFTNRSTSTSSIISYHWNFGDGTSSKKKNPQHQYLSEGSYPVTLDIISADSCTSSFTDTINVVKVAPPGCMAFFTFVFLNQSVNYTFAFTDHSVAATNDTVISWYWTFDDGTTSSVQNPVHQFTSTGNYNVTLYITTSGGCSSSYSFTLNIYNGSSPCQASFTYSQDSLGNPLKYHFHDNSIHSTSITSWQWYFDDGDSSSVQDPDHVFPYAGIYFVSLTINTSGGCSSTITYPVKIANPQPYDLWGRVYAGPYVIDKCVAYLYKEYKNNYYKPIDTVRLTSVNDTLGVYYFFQVPEGKHKVKVLLPRNSTYSQDYAPTYYGDKLKWNQASTINLFQNVSMANVNMHALVPSSGNCMINVQVNSANPKVPVENTEILLFNANGDLTDYGYADSTGKVSFNDVAKGSVYVYGEVTGLFSTPANVVLNNDYDTVNNLIINIGNTYVTGFLKTGERGKTSFKLYPNPVEEYLIIEFDSKIKAPLSLEIFDLGGRKISEGKISGQRRIKLSAETMHKGIYLLKVTDIQNNNSTSVKFIKK